MKRYRDENGRLTKSIAQIKKETAKEAVKYYRPGAFTKTMRTAGSMFTAYQNRETGNWRTF